MEYTVKRAIKPEFISEELVNAFNSVSIIRENRR